MVQPRYTTVFQSSMYQISTGGSGMKSFQMPSIITGRPITRYGLRRPNRVARTGR